MNNKLKTVLAVVLTAFTMNLQAQDALSVAEKHFTDLPESQPLAVYWYWIAGNMSKEGVVKDLEAMKRAGINRVQIGMIGEGQGTPTGPVRMFTDEWWDILHTMFKRASELGITVGLFNCPGWSQSGGPWVDESQSMRYLAMAADTIEGPMHYVNPLPEIAGKPQDVRVLAYPISVGTRAFTTQENVSTAKEIRLSASEDGIVRSLTLYPIATRATRGELFVKAADGSYNSILSFDIDRSNAQKIVGFDPLAPVTVSLPETWGREFLLKLANEGVVGRVELSDESRVERWAEKTFAKMWQTPHPMWDAYMWPRQPEYKQANVLQASQVKDLSQYVKDDGMLDWQVPAGRWVLMRTAMLPTGTTCSPAPKEGTGLETDKMSKRHIRAHFDNYIGKILERIPAQDRKTFKVIVEDSYETGGQNWTDDFIDDFKRTYGYDPVPFIPAMYGQVVGSEDLSDRFLWDLRRLVADEVSYNYVGGLSEVAHEHGLTTWLENYGHWGFPGEFLQYGSQSDEIAGEFWSWGDLGDIENRCASSCGHTYGKRLVWAESYTCGGSNFTQYPAMMKARGDRFYTEGINATLLHLYIQQPDDRVPGFSAWFGNEFNRHNTWFSQMDLFSDYMKRCTYLLQQGRYVADVAYFIGEDAPKMTGVRSPEIPQGYSYDYVNAEVLSTAHVEKGALVLQSGMRYSVLVLPKEDAMRPELLEKLSQLVRDGLVVVGPAPQRSPSMQGYPLCDERVKALAKAMWQPERAPLTGSVSYGQGRIYRDATLEEVFAEMRLVPDFTTADPLLPLLFIHKQLADGDVYFVSNQSDRQLTFDAAFRVKGLQAELWNPVTGERRQLPQTTSLTSATLVPMQLQPSESAFVVFRKQAGFDTPAGENFPKATLVARVETPWQIAFEEGRGGSANVKSDKLFDWSQSDDYKIKYFSGTATYTTQVKLGKLPQDKQLYMDLGSVMVMAKVRVNGQYVGGAWTAPYRVNVTKALHKGLNTIEVEVVNNWRNRLIGEKGAVPESERFTFHTSSSLKADSNLQASGLIGPVVIEAYDYRLLNGPTE